MTVRVFVARALFVACALCLAACPEPRSGTPPIAVSPGAASRVGLIASHRGESASHAPRARASRMAPGGQLGGPNATGEPGDFVLANDEVVFVIDGPGGGGGFAESGGNLIDAADARTRKDELGQVFTYFGTFPRQGVYTAIEAKDDPDGSAVVVARGHELYDPKLEVVTSYRLAGGDRALLLTTTVTNRGAAPATIGLGDAIQWGGVEKVAPGKARGFKGPSRGPYVGGVGRFTSYAVTSTEGEIAAMSGGAWTDTEQKKRVTIAPGASVSYARVFVVGPRADSASIVSELTRASGGEVGALAIALVDARGRRVRAPAGATIALGPREGETVLTLVAARDGDSFAGEVPPGSWVAWYAPSAGRRGAGPAAPVTVAPGKTARVTLAVSDVGRLSAGCTTRGADGTARRTPCKITVEGVHGTPTPDFGPAHVADAAKDQLFAVTGDASVALSPGDYRLTASRGPEWALATKEVSVAPGSSERVTLALSRVVDTTGYLAADFHQHTILSADAPVGTRDRVIGNAAEGVEIAVATEHNVVADLEPVVRELGLTSEIVALPGDELTSDASRAPWGHANVYPLAPDPTKPRGGAPKVRDRAPREIFAEVRAMPGLRVIQVNHPRSGHNGYFDQLAFDRTTGTGKAPGYSADFDAIEVWNGRNVEARDATLDDFLALLRTGHPVTPVANTDTHGIVGEEAGYPRTYVRVQRDDDLGAWDEARTADLTRGIRERRDVVITNGPFLRVRANGASMGGVARVKDLKRGVVDVQVEVSAAPFVRVERAELRLANGGEVLGQAEVALSPARRASGALSAGASFKVRVDEDDALVVIVRGTTPMRPVLDGDDREITPWAMSSPIWIDADGDGVALGRRAPRSSP